MYSLYSCCCSTDLTQSAFSLKLLRSMAMLSSTILFLPFVSVLLQTFQCTGGDGGWSVEPSAPCFGAAHISFTILVAIILPCFILVSVFIAAVFFERDLKSNVANAQVHGKHVYFSRIRGEIAIQDTYIRYQDVEICSC